MREEKRLEFLKLMLATKPWRVSAIRFTSKTALIRYEDDKTIWLQIPFSLALELFPNSETCLKLGYLVYGRPPRRKLSKGSNRQGRQPGGVLQERDSRSGGCLFPSGCPGAFLRPVGLHRQALLAFPHLVLSRLFGIYKKL